MSAAVRRFSPDGGEPDRHALYSDSSRYVEGDLIDVAQWEFIKQTLVRTTIWRIVTGSISVLAIAVLVLTFTLYVLGYEVPMYDGSDTSAQGVILFALSEWFGWSKSMTGNSYAATIALSLLIAFLSQAGLSLQLLQQRAEYDRLIERGREVTKHARQLYVGSGTIRFSYGKKGIRVAGNNITFDISWDAVLDAALIHVRRVKRWSREYLELSPAIQPDDATHLLVFFDVAGGNRKATDRINAAEYLVVPRERFFSRAGSTLDSSNWQEFVERMWLYKQAYIDARLPV